jgi:hypothetical protein
MIKKDVLATFIALLLLVVGYRAILQADDAPDEQSVTDVDLADSINAVINAMFEKVKPAFEHGCYDCHSDQTDYPWYHNIPGVKQLIESDIEEGREHLDFSGGFPFKTKHRQTAILMDIKEEIEEGEMPPFLYRTMHWGRLIEDERRDSVFSFIDSALTLLGGAPVEQEHEH